MMIKLFSMGAALFVALPWLPNAQPLVAEQAFVFAVKPRQSAALHLTLANPTSASVVIVGAQSPFTPQVVLRTHTQRNGQSVIESGGTITVPPKSRVRLLPGATEVVMLNLQRPLVAGDEFPLKVQLSEGKSQTIRVKITAPGQAR